MRALIYSSKVDKIELVQFTRLFTVLTFTFGLYSCASLGVGFYHVSDEVNNGGQTNCEMGER